jgi:hypothetical protein
VIDSGAGILGHRLDSAIALILSFNPYHLWINIIKGADRWMTRLVGLTLAGYNYLYHTWHRHIFVWLFGQVVGRFVAAGIHSDRLIYS